MAVKYKRGNSWILDWYDSNGKRHQKSIGDVSEDIAEAQLRKKKNEKLLGFESVIKETITFRKYAAARDALAYYNCTESGNYVIPSNDNPIAFTGGEPNDILNGLYYAPNTSTFTADMKIGLLHYGFKFELPNPTVNISFNTKYRNKRHYFWTRKRTL